MPPEKRKPAAGKATGSQEVISLAAIYPDHTENLPERQAVRIRQRFPLSWPVARLVAELHWRSA